MQLHLPTVAVNAIEKRSQNTYIAVGYTPAQMKLYGITYLGLLRTDDARNHDSIYRSVKHFYFKVIHSTCVDCLWPTLLAQLQGEENLPDRRQSPSNCNLSSRTWLNCGGDFGRLCQESSTDRISLAPMRPLFLVSSGIQTYATYTSNMHCTISRSPPI